MQQFPKLIDRLPISSMLEACDGKITVEECAAAISSMGNNKTPGSDGLSKEFYSNFFHLFALHGFMEMLNQSFEANILPPLRSTQPCIPPGSLNRVPASAGVRAGMSPLPGGR